MKHGEIRQCFECGIDFPAKMHSHIYCSAVCKERAKRNRWTQQKKEAIAAAKQRWSAQNFTKQKNTQLKYSYGIDLDQYKQILASQDGKCYICQRSAEEFTKFLCVDHDHLTQEIRGLLCTHCNKNVIGRMRDPEIFRRAYEYLAKPGTGFFAPKRKRKRYRKGT